MGNQMIDITDSFETILKFICNFESMYDTDKESKTLNDRYVNAFKYALRKLTRKFTKEETDTVIKYLEPYKTKSYGEVQERGNCDLY